MSQMPSSIPSSPYLYGRSNAADSSSKEKPNSSLKKHLKNVPLKDNLKKAYETKQPSGENLEEKEETLGDIIDISKVSKEKMEQIKNSSSYVFVSAEELKKMFREQNKNISSFEELQKMFYFDKGEGIDEFVLQLKKKSPSFLQEGMDWLSDCLYEGITKGTLTEEEERDLIFKVRSIIAVIHKEEYDCVSLEATREKINSNREERGLPSFDSLLRHEMVRLIEMQRKVLCDFISQKSNEKLKHELLNYRTNIEESNEIKVERLNLLNFNLDLLDLAFPEECAGKKILFKNEVQAACFNILNLNLDLLGLAFFKEYAGKKIFFKFDFGTLIYFIDKNNKRCPTEKSEASGLQKQKLLLSNEAYFLREVDGVGLYKDPFLETGFISVNSNSVISLHMKTNDDETDEKSINKTIKKIKNTTEEIIIDVSSLIR